MINLYQLLGISPNATPEQIRKALITTAQQQSLPLDTLQKCQTWLLDADKRKQYNIRLFAEHPEILENMIATAKLPTAETEKNVPQPISQPLPPSDNLYELLGVPTNAPDALIRDAIKQAAENDMDTDFLAQARFHLLHKQRRAKYNRSQKITNPVSRTIFVLFVLFAIGFYFLFINKITPKPNKKITTETPQTTTPRHPPAADMSDFQRVRQLMPINERNTQYHIIYYKVDNRYGRLQVVSERYGSNGASYAWHELDCANQRQRYMGHGKSLDEAMVFRPNTQLQPPEENSLAWRTLYFTCHSVIFFKKIS